MVNTKEKVAFFTVCSDEFDYLGKKMRASFKKFFPDIPLIVFGTEEIRRANRENEKLTYGFLYAYFGRQVAKHFDLVIQIDSDSVVCNTLPDIFNKNYEVASVHNNAGNSIAGSTIEGIDQKDYLNAGLVAVRGQRFWEDWYYETMDHARQLPYVEQDVLNQLFYTGDYETYILDGEDKSSWYGCSSIGKYDKIIKVGKNLILDGKVIRILHTAGRPDMKLNFSEARPEVRDYLERLMKYD